MAAAWHRSLPRFLTMIAIGQLSPGFGRNDR